MWALPSRGPGVALMPAGELSFPGGAVRPVSQVRGPLNGQASVLARGARVVPFFVTHPFVVVGATTANPHRSPEPRLPGACWGRAAGRVLREGLLPGYSGFGGFGAGDGLFEQRGQFAALLGGQPGAEVPVDRRPVYRPGAAERVSACRGEDGETGPAVGLRSPARPPRRSPSTCPRLTPAARPAMTTCAPQTSSTPHTTPPPASAAAPPAGTRDRTAGPAGLQRTFSKPAANTQRAGRTALSERTVPDTEGQRGQRAHSPHRHWKETVMSLTLTRPAAGLALLAVLAAGCGSAAAAHHAAAPATTHHHHAPGAAPRRGRAGSDRQPDPTGQRRRPGRRQQRWPQRWRRQHLSRSRWRRGRLGLLRWPRSPPPSPSPPSPSAPPRSPGPGTRPALRSRRFTRRLRRPAGGTWRCPTGRPCCPTHPGCGRSPVTRTPCRRPG